MRKNYYRKLSVKIMSENNQLVYQSRRKCEIYRDSGISKNLYDYILAVRLLPGTLKIVINGQDLFVCI